MKIRLAVLLIMLFSQAMACAENVPAGYDYPIENPLMATVAGSPTDEALKGTIVREKIYGLEMFQDRKLPPVLKNLGKHEFSLAWQSGPAPLIFAIAGTGSNYKAGNLKMLQKIFHDAGFHVICLSSTFSRRFAAMGSDSNVPGISEEDAADMYRIMKMAYETVKKKAPATEFYLTGYSLGGLNAAFLAKQDEQEKFFDFKKVLLINPPVNLYTSTAVFDEYVNRNLKGKADEFFDRIFRKVSRYFQSKGDVYLDEEFLYEINRLDPLSPEDLEGLIGASFRLSLANVAFCVDMLTRSGQIVEKNRVLSAGDSTTPYFKKVLRWTFPDYLDKFMLPYWQKTHPEDDRDALIHKISLRALAGYLKTADKIAVVHNANDIILGPGDMDFIRETFGDRARIYPVGGHLGNMLYPANVEYMTNFFKN